VYAFPSLQYMVTGAIDLVFIPWPCTSSCEQRAS